MSSPGRARIGARAWIGASATISNMVRIGEGAEDVLGAVVIRDVPTAATCRAISRAATPAT